MRPGTGSSISGGGNTSRTATGVRPLSAMRPLSSYRLRTACRPVSHHSLSMNSSSGVSNSPPTLSQPPLLPNDPALFDGQHSDASHLTVGPTFQGNPLKALLARKKPSTQVKPNQIEHQTHKYIFVFIKDLDKYLKLIFIFNKF